MNQNVIAIVQARMGSSRLPGKVLARIGEQPLLWHIVQRLRNAETVTHSVIATSADPIDDSIAEFCTEYRIECFRGSQDDVLDRYYQTALVYNADIIVRITGDCPLIDPGVIDEIVNLLQDAAADYASNVDPPSFPDGLDVEVFTFPALNCSWQKAFKRYQREHVTSYITENSALFKCVNFKSSVDASSWRLTVDYAQDLEMIREIYNALYEKGNIFSFAHIARFIGAQPELLRINAQYGRNENYNTNDV